HRTNDELDLFGRITECQLHARQVGCRARAAVAADRNDSVIGSDMAIGGAFSGRCRHRRVPVCGAVLTGRLLPVLGRGLDVGQGDETTAEPLAVWPPLGDLTLQVVVSEDAMPRRVDGKHLARSEPALLDD